MSFQQGLSGLTASSKNLDVIGNNIANNNTYGFKSSRAEFSDLYASTVAGGGSNAVGIGVATASVSQQFSQGDTVATDNPMDIAINGEGFFQVSDGINPTEYTRNGQFKVTAGGNIVNDAGLNLLGYPADSQGNILPGVAKPLTVPSAGIPPKTTTKVAIEMNLDSRAATTESAVAPGSITLDDATTYNNATSMNVYDAKGQPVAVTLYFQKQADAADGSSTWNVFAMANGSPFANEAPDANGNPTAPLTTLSFGPNGGAATAIGGNPFDPANPFTFDIPAGQPTATSSGTLPITGVQLDLTKANTNGSGFAITNLTQDGYAPGQPIGVSIDSSGIVRASYSNGQSKASGQIEMANFHNPQGLTPIGSNLWASTLNSGTAVRGVSGAGSLGVLQASALENSNVDLTSELVNMVTAQRNFQANAQTIKTQDQIMQTIVNLR